MSVPSTELAPKKSVDAGLPTNSPFQSPTYPRRVHLAERTQLEESLRQCDTRIAAMRLKLNTLGNHPSRAAFERLFHQMQGARDQVAEAVRRMPLEVGGLYHEDKERYDFALAALDRVIKDWDKVAG